MNDNDLTKAILNVLKKELGSFGDVMPSELLSSVGKKISSDMEGLIEKGGYVTKSKYDYLKKLADKLEERVSILEQD